MNRQIAKISTKILTMKKSELRELLIKAQNGDLVARNTIVVNHIKLVFNVSNKYKSNGCYGTGLTHEDLEQEGIFGLVHSISKYDMEKDKNLDFFLSFAAKGIKNAIREAIRSNKWIHKSLKENDIIISDNKTHPSSEDGGNDGWGASERALDNAPGSVLASRSVDLALTYQATRRALAQMVEERKMQIFDETFYEGHNACQAAKVIGITRQAIQRHLKQMLPIIQTLVES